MAKVIATTPGMNMQELFIFRQNGEEQPETIRIAPFVPSSHLLSSPRLSVARVTVDSAGNPKESAEITDRDELAAIVHDLNVYIAMVKSSK